MTAGIRYIVFAAKFPVCNQFSVVQALAPLVKNADTAATWLIALSLGLGWIKGRFALTKTATRVTNRILSQPSPVGISSVYGKGYLALVSCMIALGISLKWTGIPPDVRGVIDLTVGSALVHASVFYFRWTAQGVVRK